MPTWLDSGESLGLWMALFSLCPPWTSSWWCTRRDRAGTARTLVSLLIWETNIWLHARDTRDLIQLQLLPRGLPSSTVTFRARAFDIGILRGINLQFTVDAISVAMVRDTRGGRDNAEKWTLDLELSWVP